MYFRQFKKTSPSANCARGILCIDTLFGLWYNISGETILAHEYEYNADGQLYKYTNHWIGKAIVYKYNLDGKISDISEFNTTSGKHDFSREYSYEKSTGLLSYEMFDLSYLSGTTEYTEAFDRSYAYNTDGSLKSSVFNSGSTARLNTVHAYDAYNRLMTNNYTFSANNRTSSFTGSESFTYSSSGDYDSTRIETYTVTIGSNTTIYTYTYDYRNYITAITEESGDEVYNIHYAYDVLGQLVREDNEKLGKTFVHTYGPSGNMIGTKTYAYTEPSVTPSGTYTAESYTYGNTNWRDKLTAYNGTAITYDSIGNPLSYYGDRTFTWEGRELRTATTPAGWSVFAYNDNGTRALKYFNASIVTYYYYDGTRLISEKNQNETIIYIYDDAGVVIGMQYRLTTYAEDTWDVYWFERNLHGDIVAVYNTTGTKLISYTYDAWGNFTTTYYNNGASTTAVKNPFRYRGYYYDSDLQLYYLQTRYYDSVTGRFISADDISYLGANGDLIGYNLYAYCSNNPVMYTDPSGHFIVSSLLIGFAIGAVLGFGITMYADYEDDGEVFNGSVDAGAYVANSLMGGVAGAGVAYIAPAASTFFTTTYTLGTFTVAGEAVAVTVSGAEIASAAFGVGVTINAITTNKSNGYWGQKYSNDHKPDHIHLKGPNTDIRIGRDGNPLKGDGPLNAQQRKALKKLWSEFLKLFE